MRESQERIDDDPTPRPPVTPGEVLAGKYRVERVIAVGGMGVVVAASHVALQQRVALKFMLPAALANADATDRFLREARAAVRLRSEHVARVLDVGTLDSGSPYIVMEYLEGEDLRSYVEKRGPLDVVEAAELVLQACDALAEAHSLGIVHRDLKPANLFVARRADGAPLVKVLDFGISKITSTAEADLSMTKTSMVMGSPLYMSPEQMKSARGVDARADLWALGVILHELTTGAPPFRADSLGSLMAQVLGTDPIPRVEEIRPDVGTSFGAVVRRCLERDRNLRFTNVAELACALAPLAPDHMRALVERVCRVQGVAIQRAIPHAMPAGGATAAMGHLGPPSSALPPSVPVPPSVPFSASPPANAPLVSTPMPQSGPPLSGGPSSASEMPRGPSSFAPPPVPTNEPLRYDAFPPRPTPSSGPPGQFGVVAITSGGGPPKRSSRVALVVVLVAACAAVAIAGVTTALVVRRNAERAASERNAVNGSLAASTSPMSAASSTTSSAATLASALAPTEPRPAESVSPSPAGATSPSASGSASASAALATTTTTTARAAVAGAPTSSDGSGSRRTPSAVQPPTRIGIGSASGPAAGRGHGGHGAPHASTLATTTASHNDPATAPPLAPASAALPPPPARELFDRN